MCPLRAGKRIRVSKPRIGRRWKIIQQIKSNCVMFTFAPCRGCINFLPLKRFNKTCLTRGVQTTAYHSAYTAHTNTIQLKEKHAGHLLHTSTIHIQIYIHYSQTLCTQYTDTLTLTHTYVWVMLELQWHVYFAA